MHKFQYKLIILNFLTYTKTLIIDFWIETSLGTKSKSQTSHYIVHMVLKIKTIVYMVLKIKTMHYNYNN
jgi:hypothetical protein